MWSEIKVGLLAFRTSLLFVPLMFAAGGLMLSFATVYADRTGMANGLVKMLPGTGVDEEGARGVLSTVASGMLSVTSIVISLTFIALTMMSSQLGPRLLLFFMRDRTTKVVLGIFVATIIYALVSMASVGAKGDATFAPHLSFIVALALAILSLGAMIYFVNHIAQSIQADAVVAKLAQECNVAIDTLIEDGKGGGGGDPTDESIALFDSRFGDDAHRWHATRSGYLASVDFQTLLVAARELDAEIKLFFRVNTFVFDDQILALFRCGEDKVAAMREALENAIAMSERRTPAQQVNFEMSALSEVALRALSPGVNDPYTAAACVDYLGNTLSRIARVESARRLLQDDEKAYRVLRKADDLPFFLDQCIAPIIEAAAGTPIALESLTRALKRLDQVAFRERDIDAIDRQLAALRELTETQTRHPAERTRLLAMIDEDPDPVPPV